MLRAWVISQATLVDDGEVESYQGDFSAWPIVYGAGDLVIAGVKHGVGRNPTTGLRRVLIGDIYEETITTDGVRFQSTMMKDINYPVTPNVAIDRLTLELPVLLDIHSTGGYQTMAAEDWETEEPLDYGGFLWGKDTPIEPGRWGPLRNGIVLLGVPAQVVDDWRIANPEGTPTELFQIINTYIILNN